MVRTSLLAVALFSVLLSAVAAPASADPARGYVPYDGWFRGNPTYHGFAWRDPAIGDTSGRRPDFAQWSSFDQYPLRQTYPLYRGRCGTTQWPVRPDVHLCAAGVPPIVELDCYRSRCHHHGCKGVHCTHETAPTEYNRWAKAHDQWTLSRRATWYSSKQLSGSNENATGY
jgi:hypothetical protein